MKNKPLVSVIVSAYNHENYIQDMIRSIIAQTYQNIEFLIIDDGSKDSTWNRILELKPECEKRFTNIYFKTQENAGTCVNGNRLLPLASGKYVYMIASDDMAKPTAIEKELEFLEKNEDYALAVGDNEIIDGEGNICFWDSERNNIYNESDATYKTFAEFLQSSKSFKFTSSVFGTYRTLFMGNYIPNGYLIRKSIFEKTGVYTTEAPLEDWFLMLQISKYAKLKYLDEVLFSYRWHGTNTIKQKEKMRLYVEKTKKHEFSILESINTADILPDVKIFKFFYSLKNKGILKVFYYLFQIWNVLSSKGFKKMYLAGLCKITGKDNK